MNERKVTLTQTASDRKEGIHMVREHYELCEPMHRHHTPPHERRNMIYVEFDEHNEEIMKEIFKDDDTAEAAISFIHNAPPELQVLILQGFKMMGVELKARFPKICNKTVNVRWDSPVLGQEVSEEYSELYGVDGERYVDILESAPYEMAVVSRLFAFLQQNKRGE